MYLTLAWIVEEWLQSRETLGYRLMRLLLYPIMRHKTRTSKVYVDRIASAYRVLARK